MLFLDTKSFDVYLLIPLNTTIAIAEFSYIVPNLTLSLIPIYNFTVQECHLLHAYEMLG